MFDQARAQIAQTVRQLRQERRWTQAELSRRLGLSQSRLSEIEHGQGSFTAEQFLAILRLFNVPASHFAKQPANRQAELQNALARLGATHLVEDPDVLPSEVLSQAQTSIREVLVSPESPRHITALGPVLVQHGDRVSLTRLHGDLVALGLERRLGWLVESVVAALRVELATKLDRQWLARYRRAELVLEELAATLRAHARPAEDASYDLVDPNVRSPKSLERALKDASPISRRWRVVTPLRTEDFVAALRGARVGHS